MSAPPSTPSRGFRRVVRALRTRAMPTAASVEWFRALGGRRIAHAWAPVALAEKRTTMCKRVLIAGAKDVPTRRCKFCLAAIGLHALPRPISEARKEIAARVAKLATTAAKRGWSREDFRRGVRRAMEGVARGTATHALWLREMRRAGCALSRLPDHRQLELFGKRGAA